MRAQRLLIAKQIEHLTQMKGYLQYSLQIVSVIFPIPNNDWDNITDKQHESLAAFRVRFSEFQEHLGKLMRAISIEEELNFDRFGQVLAFMEKINILDDVELWTTIREARNSINHEYEDNFEKLTEFFMELIAFTPKLFEIFQRLGNFAQDNYKITPH
jgi:hypothetical protein